MKLFHRLVFTTAGFAYGTIPPREFWATRNRDHRRRPKGVHEALDDHAKAGDSAEYRFARQDYAWKWEGSSTPDREI